VGRGGGSVTVPLHAGGLSWRIMAALTLVQMSSDPALLRWLAIRERISCRWARLRSDRRNGSSAVAATLRPDNGRRPTSARAD
jgi:hypothetical protein